MTKRNDGKWTEARFRGFIKSALRSASVKWPPRYTALNEAFVGVKTNKATKRQAKHFQCAECKGEFPSSQIQIDHIDPVVDPEKGFEGWDVMVERMFCDSEGLQVLCKPCHKVKSQTEKDISNAVKRKEKNKNEK